MELINDSAKFFLTMSQLWCYVKLQLHKTGYTRNFFFNKASIFYSCHFKKEVQT